jgi:hypothetical protein
MTTRHSQAALKKHVARHAAQTRALYRYEETRFRDSHLLKRRSIGELRRLTARIWQAEKTARPDAPPAIIAGRGVYQSGRWMSYCEGRNKIVLIRQDRNILLLIHELTHAIGFTWHGVPFRSRYFHMLRRHAGRLSAATRAALAVDLKTLTEPARKKETRQLVARQKKR